MSVTAALPADWLLPDPTWSVSAGFWEGAQRSELCFPLCDSCGTYAWYPVPRCGVCGSDGFSWDVVEPVGCVYSFTVLRRAFLPQLVDRLPHGVVLVRFEHVPGVTLVSMLAAGEDPGTLEVDQPVEIVFETAGEGGMRLPCVRRTAN